MNRTCNVCGKLTECRAHHDNCIDDTAPLCHKCNRAQFKDWYSDPVNRVRKCEYQKERYWRLKKERLNRIKKNIGKSEYEKLFGLFE